MPQQLKRTLLKTQNIEVKARFANVNDYLSIEHNKKVGGEALKILPVKKEAICDITFYFATNILLAASVLFRKWVVV